MSTDRDLQKAFILHCCRRDYLKLLNVSLTISNYEHDYFPLAVYVACKIVEYRQWHHWDFVVEQLEALEKLYGKSHVGFLFKTAKFRAHLIVCPYDCRLFVYLAIVTPAI